MAGETTGCRSQLRMLRLRVCRFEEEYLPLALSMMCVVIQCIRGLRGCKFLPVAIRVVTAKGLMSVNVEGLRRINQAYLVMSNVAFSPSFMVVTPSSQPIVHRQ